MKTIFFSLLTLAMSASCNNDSSTKAASDTADTVIKIREDVVTYQSDSANLKSYVVYDENKEGKRPAVLVIHEWWGLNDYVKSRAKQLAEMGYIAMAVDMYGDDKKGNTPQEAQVLATPFYQNPQLTKTRIDAALNKLGEYAQTDTANIAAIGYCFGGYVVLNAAKLGARFNGVVSFHGGLSGAPVNKYLLTSKILVCHGEADNFVPKAEVDAFKKSMDSVNADYTFKSYADATHAFTNPQATEWGKKFNMPISYNAAADTTSWNDMKTFFGRIFNK